MDFEDIEYSPYELPDESSGRITDYPYVGWNNVLGGGGEVAGQDIYVPPQANLYNAIDMSSLQATTVLGVSLYTIVLVVGGILIGMYVMPKVVPKFRQVTGI